MKGFSDILTLVGACLFSSIMMAQSPRPSMVDNGTTVVYGDLNRYSQGRLSDFSFSGMDFSRHEGPFEPDPFSDYRVELIMTDGTVMSAFMVLNETEASIIPILEGESRIGLWRACFPSVLEAKELRILYMNQVVYSTKPSNGPIPYQPVLTQIDKDKVRIEPVQVEEVEYAYRGDQLSDLFQEICSLKTACFRYPLRKSLIRTIPLSSWSTCVSVYAATPLGL